MNVSGGMTDETDLHIVKARWTYANVGHLWCLRDMNLSVKGRVYKHGPSQGTVLQSLSVE